MLYGNGRQLSIDGAAAQFITADELQDSAGMEQIGHFLRMVVEKNDPTYMVHAHTAETDFYKIVNRAPAEQMHQGGRMRISNSPPWFVGLPRSLFHEQTVRQYSWAGTTYRGMQMSTDDLNQYTVGKCIITKAFLSTSRARNVAEQFLRRTPPAGVQLVICSYTITNETYFFYLAWASRSAACDSVAL